MVLTTLLLVGIFLFLYFMKGSFESKLNTLSREIAALHNKIDALKISDLHAVNDSENAVVTATPIVQKVETTSIFTEFVPKPSETTDEILEVVDSPKIIIDTAEEPKVHIAAKINFWKKFTEKNPDLEKFIGENLISKIGILILVLGISYFVKYSIAKGWISEPLRVGIGLLAGSLVLGVAHKLREKYAAFSSVFVAGAFSIFYFTIGVAFHDYHLFSQEVAFLIMIGITGCAAAITIIYNRLELAILTMIAGFAVPFMVSTGQGNYAILFTYILILDVGILCIGYYKKWPILNLLAFGFTSVLFAGWLFGELDLPKPHYASALAFGFTFYVLFCAINIIGNMRNKSEFSLLQMGIISANTFLFYGIGIAILNAWQPQLRGLFTATLALFNLGYAFFIYKNLQTDKRVLYLLIGLTLTFVTLAIPVQFSGHYITMFWAVESVMLLWLSQKSKIATYKLCAVIVHILMLISLLMDWFNLNLYESNATMIFNGVFFTGLVAVASFYFNVKLLQIEDKPTPIFGYIFNPTIYAVWQRNVGVLVLYFVGLFEVATQTHQYLELDASADALIWFYHLLFCAIFCYLILKNQYQYHRFISIIAALNILIFIFIVYGLAFNEHKHYIETGIASRAAFYSHYLSLATIVYFAIILHTLYVNKKLNAVFYKTIYLWVALFLIVYLMSTELVLHGLVMSNSPVTLLEIQQVYPMENANDQIAWRKSSMAYDKISFVRTTIFKSGMPVLWGIMAFVILIIGIKKPSRIMRIMALSLLGLTILKLFLYDIRNASETGRIIAFILLGVLILIISFVYQKLKVLLIADVEQFNKKGDE